MNNPQIEKCGTDYIPASQCTWTNKGIVTFTLQSSVPMNNCILLVLVSSAEVEPSPWQ